MPTLSGPRSGGGANARPWLWCRGRRSTAPRRPTPSLMTTVRCRSLPLRPGISSSKREVVCCAQAGRTTAHEPSMLAALLLKPRRGIRTRGTTQQRYHQHSLSLPGPLPVRTQLIASCPLSPKASGWDSWQKPRSGMCRQKGALALVIGHQRDSTACRASRSYIRSAMKGEASAVSRRTASTACA